MAIRPLSPQVVDQIAAGEVVERPAHLVKELVENSLDAGATEIEVDFDQGGRYVRVKDNGHGIPEAELGLALARHATSKILNSSDIWRISSYGFRGEALATISAVSRLQLISKTANQEYAASLTSEFGAVGDVLSQGGEQGTTVSVSDLFANVPARLKFLKSEAGETAQIKHVLKGLALANPGISFRFRQKGKLWVFWPGADSLKDRAEQILEMTPLFRGTGSDGAVSAEVIMAPPQMIERTSRQIWIFVQGRLVQDRGLQAAVSDAYRNLLMHGEFPIAVVNVTCDPEFVDINIHPTKANVKFQRPGEAFRAVHRAARSQLETAPWIPAAMETEAAFALTPPPRVEETMAFAEVLPDQSLRRTQFAARSFAPPPKLEDLKKYAPPRMQTEAPKQSYEATSGVSNYWKSLQVLGQAQLTYIIAQDSRGLVLVDQHAAHERVAFEKLMAAWKGGQIEVQGFLLPLTVNLEACEVEAITPYLSELRRLGLEVEITGPTVVGVRSAPALLKESAIDGGLRSFAREVSERGGSFAVEKAIADICASMACHSVVRAGQPLSHEQMTELLEQMDDFALSSFCPHGRPVSVEWSWPQLEREFGRLV